MIKIIIIVLFILWILSYIRFRHKMKYFTLMADYLQAVVMKQPTTEHLLRFSSALIEIQRYKDAYDILEKVSLSYPNHPQMERIKMNMEFCTKPIPGVNSPKNYSKSWLHNFIVVRLGRRRYIFLTEEDHLTTSSLMRNT